MSAKEHKAQMSRHARRLGWISPEPKWGRNLRSCDMPLCAPIRDRVEVVPPDEQLAGVTAGLVESRA